MKNYIPQKNDVIEIAFDKNGGKIITYYVLDIPKETDKSYKLQLLTVNKVQVRDFYYISGLLGSYIEICKIYEDDFIDNKKLTCKLLAPEKRKEQFTGIKQLIKSPRVTYKAGTWIKKRDGSNCYLIVALLENSYIVQNTTCVSWLWKSIDPFTSFICISQQWVETSWEAVAKPKLCKDC